MSTDAKILIVEDDEDLGLMMALRLKREAYLPLVARDASEAVSIAGRDAPDLILLDIGLPGMSGYALLELLKRSEALRRVPVIMMSGFDQSVHGPKAIAAGALAFVQKPFHWSDLLNLIRMALSSSMRMRRRDLAAAEARA